MTRRPIDSRTIDKVGLMQSVIHERTSLFVPTDYLLALLCLVEDYDFAKVIEFVVVAQAVAHPEE